jgi:serine/threonine protein kinase
MNRERQAEGFLQGLKRVQQLADQTAVHRKKFEFALSQLRRFCQSYSSRADATRISEPEVSAALSFNSELTNFRNLIGSYLLRTWSLPTIENPCNFVLDQLKLIFTKIREAAVILDSACSLDIDPDSPQWLQYHILDLRAIRASFTQYLSAQGIEKQLADSIRFRLVSLDRTLAESQPEDGPPRVFSPIPVHYQSWRVSYSDFTEEKAIGVGISATDFYGHSKVTGEPIAIKKFKFQKLNGPKLQSFQREVAVLATAQHPALLRLIGATDTPPFCIITEWMPNGSLYEDLHLDHRLDATGRTIAAFDVARGMQFLHSRQIAHRDMKSLNVLLDAHSRIRICNFGFSRHTSEGEMTQNIGTPHWMAPELMVRNANYSSKVDVYAYGIVLWELATAQTPFNGLQASEIIREVSQHDLRPNLPTDVNPGMRDLITQCWDRDPDVRPTFDEIVIRLKSTEAVFNGTNRDVFLKYVHDSETSGEQLAREVDSMVGEVLDGQMPLKKATRRLQKTGIPPDLLDSCWCRITAQRDHFAADDLAHFVALFLKSSRLADAAELLRRSPGQSIPADVMNMFVCEIPTGSQETDTNVVVAACRNRCADLCAVYATKPLDVALALNVVSAVGVDRQLHAAVIDRSVHSLRSPCPDLALAALRCLLSLREFRRISFAALAEFIASIDQHLSTCAFVALAVLPIENCFPPPHLFDALVKRIEADERAVLSVVASCRDETLAAAVIRTFESKAPAPSESILKILAAAARHASLRGRIRRLVDASILLQGLAGLERQVASLNAILG